MTIATCLVVGLNHNKIPKITSYKSLNFIYLDPSERNEGSSGAFEFFDLLARRKIWIFSDPDLSRLLSYETIMMAEKIFERYSEKPETSEDMRSMIIGSIGYWRRYLIKNRIDLVLHGTASPHAYWNYTLAAAASAHSTPQLTINADFISDEINLMSFPGNKVYPFDGSKDKFNSKILSFCLEQRKSIRHPDYIQISLISEESIFKVFLYHLPRRIISYYKKIVKWKKFGVYFVGAETLREDASSAYQTYKYFLKTVRDLYWVIESRKNYKKLSMKNGDVNEYIETRKLPVAVLFANYQPEATTTPDAGTEGITKCLIGRLVAEGYLVLYKEHPMTLRLMPNNVFNQSRTYKSERFFQDIISCGVNLIPIDANNDDLVGYADLVVSCTGTISLQAALKGKRSAIFGRTWYGCPPGIIDANLQEIRDSELIHNQFDEIAKYLSERWSGSICNVAGVMTGSPKGGKKEVDQFFEGIYEAIPKIIND